MRTRRICEAGGVCGRNSEGGVSGNGTEAEAEIAELLDRYMWAVAAATLLGEDPPESPLAEILAIREEALSEFLAD